MNRANGDYTIVPLIFAQSQDGALNSDIINLKNWPNADIWIMIGAVTKAGAITMKQGKNVTICTTALSFTRYLRTGFMLKYDGASVSTPAAAGETVTGAGGGIGYVARDLGDKVICYAYNGTTFVDNEVLTFSGGKTAVADGIQYNEDIMVEVDASSDTFDAAAVASKMYCIPIRSAMLTDGYNTIKLAIADMDTTAVAAWAVLYNGRYLGDPSPTAIY